MGETNYNHWRNLTDLSHLRAETLAPGEDLVLTIKEIKGEKITDNQGKVEEKPVAYFAEEGVLPMILNVTNCKIIEKVYNTGNIYDWLGKKIQIFASSTKVAGNTVPCLRIRPYIPQSTEPEYKCSVCGKTISKEIHDQSIAKYGKSYCSAECLKKATKGEDIL